MLVPAALVGGAIAGPFLACLYDTVLRALRDAPGCGMHPAPGPKITGAVLPRTPGIAASGGLTGLFLGSSASLACFLRLGLAAPSTGTVALFLFSWLVFLVLSTLYWPQLVLFDQRASVRLRNALLFTIRHFWLTLGVALLQLVWWLLMVLFAPWTLLLLPFVGVWFDLFAALFLLYRPLDEAFSIEDSIARAFPEQAPRYEE